MKMILLNDLKNGITLD